MSELGRSIALVRGFRHEADNPQDFYRFLAEDTVAQVRRYAQVEGAVAVDVGGGPGYVAEAFSDAGAECFVVDPSATELTLHGRQVRRVFLADGCWLPIADGSVDISVSSNVIEHVRQPKQFLSELVRVVKPGGLTWLSFTNWYSPWGGHETSPWHYLGGERAVRHYQRRQGHQPKNLYGESLFRLHIQTVLGWVRTLPDIQLLDTYPRYYPSWTRPLAMVPGLREIATWNLALVLRRRGATGDRAQSVDHLLRAGVVQQTAGRATSQYFSRPSGPIVSVAK